MPRLVFDHVTKSFGDTQVIQSFTASVDDGEFLVLLGPSGCGKSTLLRMIAGLADVTSGRILFDDEDVTTWDVRRRNVAFVFQSYALYPQMTVRQNIAFPLIMSRFKEWQHLPLVSHLVRRRLMRSASISNLIDSIAEQMGLTEMLDRRPSALSGGQRQRVALARSLVREPSMYLLDEPLSNLDAQLRTQMRTDITALHRTVRKTFVYVTHDQVEAMTMATRMIIVNKGVIQQIGTPDEVYDAPCNIFVAQFVGAPPMNLLDADVLSRHDVAANSQELPPRDDLRRLTVGVRPEHVRIAPGAVPGLPGRIEVIERHGSDTLIGCILTAGEQSSERGSLIFAKCQSANGLHVGEGCTLLLDPASFSWFDREAGERIENLVHSPTMYPTSPTN